MVIPDSASRRVGILLFLALLLCALLIGCGANTDSTLDQPGGSGTVPTPAELSPAERCKEGGGSTIQVSTEAGQVTYCFFWDHTVCPLDEYGDGTCKPHKCRKSCTDGVWSDCKGVVLYRAAC